MKVLIKLFIKDNKNTEDPIVRSKYGKLASILGIFLNIILFVLKFIIGTLFYSVSIRADAFNNLSDAGSSIVSLISISYANKPADEDHPFGHERMEYIGSMIVAFIIFLFAITLVRDSVNKIINPEVLKFDILMFVVLIISIVVKLYMYLYNKKYGKEINSSVMKATAYDSISDVMATSVVLISLLVSKFSGVMLDGYMGLVVALFIFKCGYEIIKETFDALLGAAPDPDLIKLVNQKMMSYDGILGVHDLMVHSYGPRRTFISAHAEVDSRANINESHDVIDNIEKDFKNEYNINLVIHMDPIVTDDNFTNQMRTECALMIKNIDPSLSLHDFRVVKGKTHNNILFDVVLPYSCKLSESELLSQINQNLPQGDIPNYAVVTVDNDYIIQPKK